MITVTIFRRNDAYLGFRSEGHAGYAEEGYDILCAAVSALTINCANSIERIAGDPIEDREEDGFLECRFPKGLSEGGRILMDSMLLGLEMASETTDEKGQPFLKLQFEEV